MSRLDQLSRHCEVLIIGAGPAGLAAATVTAGAGLDTVLVDEGAGPGGQVWRAVSATPVMSRPVLGEEYWKGVEVVRAFLQSGVEYVPATTAWSLEENGRVGLSSGGTARTVAAQRVIVATGAQERPFPVPGWTLPGVMTVGGAQTLLKASGLYPSGRLVIAGSGPLVWLYAAQLLRAGGKIDTILDTTDAANRMVAASRAARFAASSYLAKGLKLIAEVRRKVKVASGVTDVAIEGGECASGVTYQQGKAQRHVSADIVLLHQGVVPQVNLAMSAGVPHRWDDRQLCFAPEVDDLGRTSLERILIAGDSAGIAGWEAAVERGRLAGIGVVEALKPGHAGLPDVARVRRRLAALEAPRGFLDAFYRPAAQFRIPKGDTIVCRCEEVRAQEIEKAVDLGCLGPAQLKSFTRCGMGPCQGRLCGLTVTEMIAARRGVSPAEVGHYRIRPPVKPLTLGEFASLPADDSAIAAVAGRRR